MSDREATVTPGAELSVLVVGMHRSGTSAIAEALSAAGLEIGPGDALMRPRLENPSFFGERQDVAGLDDRLLAALGWTWDAPAAAPLPTPPQLDDLVADGRRLASSLLADGMRLFKDPRVSVLLPWWRRMLLDRFVAVLPIRAPEEVAWSLSVRDGLPFELGLALWLTYHRHLAAGLDGLPVIVVDYDALTTEPVPVVSTVIEELDRLGVGDGFDGDAAAAAIHPTLRRTTQPTATDDPLLAAARAASEAWTGDRVRTFDRFSITATAPAGWEVALLDLQRRHAHATLRAADAGRSRDGLERALDAARSQVELAHEATAIARRDAAAARAEAEAARAEAEAARAEVQAARAEVQAARAEVQAARARGRIPGVGGIRHAARQVSDTLAELPVTSALSRNSLFDAQWYLERYPDVRAAGLDPWRHYRRHGVAEGRDPNPWFRTTRYLDENPDVRASGMNPLDHYLRHGAAEGRGPTALARGARRRDARPGEHDGGGSDPPARSGLDGHGGLAPRPTRTASQRGSARIGAWLGGLVPTHLPVESTVLTVGATQVGRVNRLTLVPIDRWGDGRARAIPNSDTTLIARLEWHRSRGAAAIVLSAAARALLDGVPALQRHLERRYPVIATDAELGVVRDLRGPVPSAGAVDLAALIEDLQADTPMGLSVLDRTRSRAATGLPGVRLVTDDPTVPWPPRSVDVVLVDADVDGAQARRVAVRAVITLPSAPDATPQVLRLDTAADGARVSIVIPHHGPLDVVRTCLTSLRETTLGVAGLEIVVVDDATPGLDRAALEACVGDVPGGRLLVNDTNLGFLGSANRGAAAATGDILVFLNNDTLLLPGWLPALTGTFRDHPQAGVVGGRLVYPDGRLQEAGGLVFRDGSAEKLGYGDADPDAPMYTFLRDTDYVSGALLATPRVLFEELGGFDRIFGFGFYEDTDYCFRVRQAGRRVLYQPASTIIHVEGATAGTDPTMGPKRSQVENGALFRDRWAGVLDTWPHRPQTMRPEDWYAAAMSAATAQAGAR